jgi:hypothetical protein
MNSKFKFTAAKIAALRPPASGEDLYRDAALTGFGYRLASTGKGTWFLDLQIKGGKKYVRKKIGNADRWALDAARSTAKEWLLDADREIDPIIKMEQAATAAAIKIANDAVTVAKLADLHLLDIKKDLRASTYGEYARLLKHVCAALGERVARDLTEADVEGYIARHRTPDNAIELAKRLEAIRRLCKWGTKAWNKDAKGISRHRCHRPDRQTGPVETARAVAQRRRDRPVLAGDRTGRASLGSLPQDAARLRPETR